MATTSPLEAGPPKTSFRHIAQVAAISSSATVIALGVILGALLVVNHYYLQCGPINSFSQLFGDYFYLPLEISGGLLAILLGNVLIAKCCKDKKLISPEGEQKKSMDRKIGATAALATFLAIGIIFGAFIFASHYGQNLGVFTSSVQQITQLLGDYFYLPLLISSAAMTLMIAGFLSISNEKKPIHSPSHPQWQERRTPALYKDPFQGEGATATGTTTLRHASLTLSSEQRDPLDDQENPYYNPDDDEFEY